MQIIVKKSKIDYILNIDEDDFFSIPQKYKIRIIEGKAGNKYAMLHNKSNRKENIMLHRFIMKCPKGLFVDHKDGNGLNNNRDNLRIVTVSENNYNKKIHYNNKSGYKGVVKHKCGKYRVVIFKDGKQIHGGYFSDKIEAAKKFNDLAKKLFGDFAKLNEI